MNIINTSCGWGKEKIENYHGKVMEFCESLWLDTLDKVGIIITIAY